MVSDRQAIRGFVGELAPNFVEALEDDLNTPEAVTVLRRLYSEGESTRSRSPARGSLPAGICSGFFKHGLAEWNGWRPAAVQIDEIFVQRLRSRRALAARAAKNWAESDRIRDELVAMGIALKDNKDGTTSWEVKR